MANHELCHTPMTSHNTEGIDHYLVNTDVVDVFDGSAISSLFRERVLSTDTTGLFCRQLAIHANLASLVYGFRSIYALEDAIGSRLLLEDAIGSHACSLEALLCV
jgi:hypothetical protein